MTRRTGPDCAVMCNLVNIHTYKHTNIYTYIHTYLHFVNEGTKGMDTEEKSPVQ